MRVFRELPTLNQSIITIGSFDGLHLGHQHLIRETKKLALQKNGESTIITFEPHPRIILQPNSNFRLLNSTEEKLKLFEALSVDNLILFPFTKEISELSAEVFIQQFIIEKLNPIAVVLGYDHKFGKNRKGSKETFLELNKKVSQPYDVIQVDEYIPKDGGNEHSKVSSTEIRNQLYLHAIKKANVLLGYEFHIIGSVVEGKKIGRTLGYPTANIEVNNAYKLIPPRGIYSGTIEINGKKHLCATSISTNPTIAHDNSTTIEAHILDFNENIYGQEVTLYFDHFIREEKRFDSLEDLKIAIEDDIKTVRQFHL